MAQLPGNRFLIQQIDAQVILFGRDTEAEIVRFDPADANAAAAAQGTIHVSAELTDEEKAFAHFWSGYFYAHATAGLPASDPVHRPEKGPAMTTEPTIIEPRSNAFIAEQAALDAEIEAHEARNMCAAAEWRQLMARGGDLADRRLAALTDAEILADADTSWWLCRTAFSHTGAYNRLRALTDAFAPGVLSTQGVDARKGWDDACLPALQVRLGRDADPTAAVTGIAAWFAQWALGRTDVAINVFERTLSEFGSYHIDYAPGAEPEATLICTRYYHETMITSGSLPVVLTYVARHHWYGVDDHDDVDDLSDY